MAKQIDLDAANVYASNANFFDRNHAKPVMPRLPNMHGVRWI
jgi:hypothetical protein